MKACEIIAALPDLTRVEVRTIFARCEELLRAPQRQEIDWHRHRAEAMERAMRALETVNQL